MRIAQRYYFVVCFTIARESDIHFFFAMVHIYIRYIDAFVKRAAFAQIFAGEIAGGVVFTVNLAPCFQPDRLRVVLFDTVQL